MSLMSVVFIILLVLKLLGIGVVATWSWWLVTLPLWIGFAIWAAVIALAGGVAGLAAVVYGVASLFSRKPKRRIGRF